MNDRLKRYCKEWRLMEEIDRMAWSTVRNANNIRQLYKELEALTNPKEPQVEITEAICKRALGDFIDISLSAKALVYKHLGLNPLGDEKVE